MAFSDDLARHVEQIRGRIPHVQGEQATKQALVVPLLQVLGYDVFDPREVRPEYVADFAVKKHGQFEKVDYALFVDGQPAIFIECKPVGAALADHEGQLSRYFNATPTVKLAIITDGVKLRAFTDLQSPNVMDSKPWISIDLLSMKPPEIDTLRRFRRGDYSATEVAAMAEETFFYSAMVDYLSRQLREPSEGFVRFVAGEIQAAGRVTGRIVERLTPILRKAVQSVIVEHVARSFEPNPSTPASDAPPANPAVVAPPAPAPVAEEPSSRDGIVTTAEELALFEQISKWLREVSPDAKVVYRDSKSYLTLHQDNLRKWFVRIGADKRPLWLSVRHVAVDEARRLAPGVEVADGGSLGGARFSLPQPGDLAKVRTAIITSYQREAERRGEDASADGGDAPN